MALAKVDGTWKAQGTQGPPQWKASPWPLPYYPHSDLFSLLRRSSVHPFLSLLFVANLNSVRPGWQVFDEHSSYGSLLLHPSYPWTPTKPVELAESVTSSPDSAWWVPQLWLQEPGLTGLGLQNRDWTPSKTEIDGNFVFKCKSEKLVPTDGAKLMRYWSCQLKKHSCLQFPCSRT